MGALLAGCGAPASELPVPPLAADATLCCVRGNEAISIRYLGSGGWLFRMGEAALLTAPFFSNPSVVAAATGPIATDTAAVDRHLPPVDDVSAILVGHAHYDHLMDVPYIARRKAPAAKIYGSRTAVNLLHGDPELDPDRLREVESAAGDHTRAGAWVEVADGRIRFMPLRSGHAPHLMGVHLWDGEVEVPAERLPRLASEWVEGLPLAYLIDFLDEEGRVVYRIHYQDAASMPPKGFPPPLSDGVDVDLAIVCPPGFEQVEGYPEGVVRMLEPRYVLLGHWEDFLRGVDEPLRAVPGTDLTSFVERLESVLPPDGRWILPEPGADFQVRPTEPGGAG